MSSNVASSTANGSATGAKSALHLPHFPALARNFAGTRFFWPQARHSRITDIGLLLLFGYTMPRRGDAIRRGVPIWEGLAYTPHVLRRVNKVRGIRRLWRGHFRECGAY